ncbi:MAG TPA: twin-arginine translocation signal domain-containing protein, partial [Candidatus Binatia bacterium]|nr:twin-arginine translocation signal domain-containing protein [Candidatus Binatia bacterium]
MARHTSIETRHYAEREALFRGLQGLDRRAFLKVSLAAAGAALASGARFHPHSFVPVSVADAAGGPVEPFTFAYISDSHLYKRELNDRFVRQL